MLENKSSFEKLSMSGVKRKFKLQEFLGRIINDVEKVV